MPLSDLTPMNYVDTLSAEAERPHSFRGETRADFQAWLSSFRPRLKSLIGLDAIQERGECALEPQLIERVELADYVREEWTIQSEPGFQVPFYVLRPRHAQGPLPLVITPHGHGSGGKRIYAGIWHNEQERLAIVEGDRDIAVQAVRLGYMAIAPDMRGLGSLMYQADREAGLAKSCPMMQLRALLFGRTLVGERVWDVMRLIDWALTRPDVDAERIAITGNSGGGKVAIYAAACDPRIKVAVSSSHFGVYQHSIAVLNHCPCNFEPGLLREAELYDVAGLVAPRGFMAVVGNQDPNHPYWGAQEAFRRVQNIYKAAGVPENCGLHIADGGHRYYKGVAWPFIRQWLDTRSTVTDD